MTTININSMEKKVLKTINLVDGNGNKLKRKIRRDSKGLFVINHGMKGYIKKTVDSWECSKFLAIEVTRKVDYYVAL